MHPRPDRGPGRTPIAIFQRQREPLHRRRRPCIGLQAALRWDVAGAGRDHVGSAAPPAGTGSASMLPRCSVAAGPARLPRQPGASAGRSGRWFGGGLATFEQLPVAAAPGGRAGHGGGEARRLLHACVPFSSPVVALAISETIAALGGRAMGGRALGRRPRCAAFDWLRPRRATRGRSCGSRPVTPG